MRKSYFGAVSVVLVMSMLIFGCTAPDTAPADPGTDEVQQEAPVEEPKVCPESCDDNDECTVGRCDESTGFACVQTPVLPCCGNGDCEETEDHDTCPSDCEKPPLDPEVQALVDKGNEKATKYSYVHIDVSNKDSREYVIYGSRMKVVFPNEQEMQGFSFDTAYIDLEAGKGSLYCSDKSNCRIPGSGKEISEQDIVQFIPTTPVDILNSITNGEIKETTTQDKKPCSRVEFLTEDGMLASSCIWTYGGIPLNYIVYDADRKVVESLEFNRMVVGTIKSDDVTMPTLTVK